MAPSPNDALDRPAQGAPVALKALSDRWAQSLRALIFVNSIIGSSKSKSLYTMYVKGCSLSNCKKRGEFELPYLNYVRFRIQIRNEMPGIQN